MAQNRSAEKILLGSTETELIDVVATVGEGWRRIGPKPNRTLYRSPDYEVRARFASEQADWVTFQRAGTAVASPDDIYLTEQEAQTAVTLLVGPGASMSWSRPHTGGRCGSGRTANGTAVEVFVDEGDGRQPFTVSATTEVGFYECGK